MGEHWNIEQFKAELERFLHQNRTCNKNQGFLTQNRAKIPGNCVLLRSNLGPGRVHFWWLIDRKVYDPTVWQFTADGVGRADREIRENLTEEEKAAFDAIIRPLQRSGDNYVYDESIETNANVRDVLRKWYFNLSSNIIAENYLSI
jgi:hypothetical protein